MNMEKQTWYTVFTTHESGLKVESRRFGYEGVKTYIARCIDEHGPLTEVICHSDWNKEF